MGMEKICAFAALQTAALFELENNHAVEVAENLLKFEPEFLHTVVSPQERIQYVFKEKDILERFFNENRIQLLEEVKGSEKASNAAK